ncbi:MAG: type IV toxin-antitoxin system AbiEi family antitoxin domain-containing protein [Bacteroidetes bacterium]|nr:type IV toxin-antitoxin system AbiEi family antitoxin domain-containing protein [Bacteroidota bacterium]MCY4206228.1 type IV toxin-antitoxin system AbiEi family antitoxin domain-containing protein [Bacteroidota bacterium]
MNTQIKIPKGRLRLATVIQSAGRVIRADDVEKSLDVDRPTASKLLSRWRSQGWLRRAGPGVYVQVPIEYIEFEQVLTDPWILVPELFNPAYVAGRTAAEYWGLTEQIFLDLVVMTGQPVKEKYQKRLGLRFTLKHICSGKIFGMKHVWNETIRIAVSDVHRTMLDILDDPELGGGIQHVEDCFSEYLRHEHRNDKELISYASRLGNGAVFKRLGFLAERKPNCTYLMDACKEGMTKGNAKLQPGVPNPRLVSKWRLWVPESWAPKSK